MSHGGDAAATSVEVVIPVFNEESQLGPSIDELHAYLSDHCPYSWRVTIADNASTDDTHAVARSISAKFENVEVMRLERKGRGHALRCAWLVSTADIVAYMDVDLSTNLRAFIPLIDPLVAGSAELSIGSRLLPTARVTRQPKREFISRAYNAVIRILFFHRFSDAQCGFKALRGSVARELIPQIEDESWFFDTELLLLAEENGYRIHEVPVDWIEDLDSWVHIVATAIEDLKGLARVRLQRWQRRRRR